MASADDNQTPRLNCKKFGKDSIKNSYNSTDLTNLTNTSQYSSNKKFYNSSNLSNKLSNYSEVPTILPKNSESLCKYYPHHPQKLSLSKISLSKLFVLKLGLSLAALGLLSKGLVWAEEVFSVEEYPPASLSQEVAPSVTADPILDAPAPIVESSAIEPTEPTEPEVYTAPFQENYQQEITAPPSSEIVESPTYFEPEPLYIPEEQYVSPPFEQVEAPPPMPAEELPPVTLPNWQEIPASNYADNPDNYSGDHSGNYAGNHSDNNNYENSNYIDQTPYEVGATDHYEAPEAIIFTERDRGCDNGSCDVPIRTAETIPPSGNSHENLGLREDLDLNNDFNNNLNNNFNNNYAGTPENNYAQENNYVKENNYAKENSSANTLMIPLNNYEQYPANPLAIRPEPFASENFTNNGNNWVTESTQKNDQAETNIYEPIYSANSENSVYETYYQDQTNQGYYSPSGDTMPVTEVAIASILPAQVSGLFDIDLMMDSGLAYYNRTQRPGPAANNGNTSLLFPLSLPAPITSTFGWRQHPVLGYSRFHTGTDLGAEQGTPVVAVLAGRVAIADWLGGYGITVVLAHEKNKSESLYGHLSEIFVKPGEWVQQGEVIGRVGSTGMSTGPHLHFEMRELTKDGWVTKSADEKITVGLSELLRVLKIDKLPTLPKIALNDLKKQTMDKEGMPKLPPLPPGFAVAIPDLEPPYPELMEPVKPQRNRPNNQPVISQKN